jgi:hypothetical protein
MYLKDDILLKSEATEISEVTIVQFFQYRVKICILFYKIEFHIWGFVCIKDLY